ncbi:hypothetical protein THAOC_01474, partial [Thalassiosira oceanica]
MFTLHKTPSHQHAVIPAPFSTAASAILAQGRVAFSVSAQTGTYLDSAATRTTVTPLEEVIAFPAIAAKQSTMPTVFHARAIRLGALANMLGVATGPLSMHKPQLNTKQCGQKCRQSKSGRERTTSESEAICERRELDSNCYSDEHNGRVPTVARRSPFAVRRYPCPAMLCSSSSSSSRGGTSVDCHASKYPVGNRHDQHDLDEVELQYWGERWMIKSSGGSTRGISARQGESTTDTAGTAGQPLLFRPMAQELQKRPGKNFRDTKKTETVQGDSDSGDQSEFIRLSRMLWPMYLSPLDMCKDNDSIHETMWSILRDNWEEMRPNEDTELR